MIVLKWKTEIIDKTKIIELRISEMILFDYFNLIFTRGVKDANSFNGGSNCY